MLSRLNEPLCRSLNLYLCFFLLYIYILIMPVECVVPLTVKRATTRTMRGASTMAGNQITSSTTRAGFFDLAKGQRVHRVYGATMRGNWVTRRRLIHRKKTKELVSMGCRSFHFLLRSNKLVSSNSINFFLSEQFVFLRGERLIRVNKNYFNFSKQGS